MSGRIVKVESWEEFKQLIVQYAPKSLAYNIEKGLPGKHLTGLRLILPVRGIQYVFIDTAATDRLRKTGIPLHTDRLGNIHIKDEDVLNFVRTEVKRKDLKLHSYWTI